MLCPVKCFLSSGCCLSLDTLRLVFAAVAMSVFDIVFGMVSCKWLFSWVYRLEPTYVWRKMNGGPGLFFMAGMLVLHFFLAVVYSYLNVGIPYETLYMKGLFFGLCLWGINTLPMVLSTYSFMNVASGVLIYWIFSLGIQLIAKSFIVAFIYGK